MCGLQTQLEDVQRAICANYGAEFVPSPAFTMTGFAQSTKGLLPINGLRHPVEGQTSGWYIWCGEEFLETENFFDPIHTAHLYDECPEIRELLGLPPGYRFLLAGDVLDVWYDASLLKI